MQTTLELLSALLTAEMKQTFYRLQVHAGTSTILWIPIVKFFLSCHLQFTFLPSLALQPKDVWEFFDAVILQAEDVQAASSTTISKDRGCSLKPPVVTVGGTLNCISS